MKIHKVLMEEAGGDSASEYESDGGELSTREHVETAEPKYTVKENKRIFKHLKINDKSVTLP